MGFESLFAEKSTAGEVQGAPSDVEVVQALLDNANQLMNKGSMASDADVEAWVMNVANFSNGITGNEHNLSEDAVSILLEIDDAITDVAEQVGLDEDYLRGMIADASSFETQVGNLKGASYAEVAPAPDNF